RRGLPDPGAGSAERLRRLGNAQGSHQAVPRRKDLQAGPRRVRQVEGQGRLGPLRRPSTARPERCRREPAGFQFAGPFSGRSDKSRDHHATSARAELVEARAPRLGHGRTTGEQTMSERRFTNQQIDRLLRPKSVAVIGASDRTGALGATLLNNLVQYEFAGEIYPVNPKRDELLGLKVYHSVEELPEGIDCAVLAIPRPFVLDTVRQLAARKCGAVVIYSAGFSEAGEEGMRDQLELAAIAAEHGMVIEGPNCLGCTNYVARVPLTFVETNMRTPPKGTRAVGIASQSGAL